MIRRRPVALRSGRWYRLRNGALAGPLRPYCRNSLFRWQSSVTWHGVRETLLFAADGANIPGVSSDFDITAQVQRPPRRRKGRRMTDQNASVDDKPADPHPGWRPACSCERHATVGATRVRLTHDAGGVEVRPVVIEGPSCDSCGAAWQLIATP